MVYPLYGGSRKVFGRIRPAPKPLIFMRFHAVLLGKQHAMWSKPHNGKVRLNCSSDRADFYKERSHSLPFLCNVRSRFLCSADPQETQWWPVGPLCNCGK